jgi:hypothetical protein
MDKVVSTLRVFRQKKAELADLRSGKSTDANFSDATFNPNAAMDLQANKTKSRGAEAEDDSSTLILIVIGIAAVVFAISKSKKKNSSKKKGKE